jgi:hypothetical protein
MTATTGHGKQIVAADVTGIWDILFGTLGTLYAADIARTLAGNAAVTTFNTAGYMVKTPDQPQSISGNIRALWKRAAPESGHQLAVTHSGSPVTHVNAWTLNITQAALDLQTVTADADGRPWRNYVADGVIDWSGSWTPQADDTNPTEPQDLYALTPGEAISALTLQLNDDTNPNQFIGNAIVTNQTATFANQTATVPMPVTFQGAGTLSVTGDGNVFGTTAASTVVVSETNVDGLTTAGTLKWTEAQRGGADGRTWSGSAFLTALNISATTQGLIEMSVDWQGTGAWTAVAV